MEAEFGVESPLFVAIRALLSTATVALLGASAFRWVVLPRYGGPAHAAVHAAVAARLARWILAFAVLALLANVARLAAQHLAVFGAEAPPSRETLTTLVWRAAWGRGWWIASLSAAVLALLAPRLRALASRAWPLATIAASLLALAQPLAGHPAAAAFPALAIAGQFLHLVAAGGWIGGLAALTLVAIPASQRLEGSGPGERAHRVAGLVRAFSPAALGFAALLASSGAVAAWDNLGSLQALWLSGYGRTLALKLSLLGIVAGLGAYNWRRVLPVLDDPAASVRLNRSARAELLAGLLVIIVSAVLVATPMPDE